MKVVIVMPSYNEAENIGRLIDALATEFPQIPNHDMHLLVVDGNSPDGTPAVVKNLQSKYPWIHLLVEEKKTGLGSAYLTGFHYAMKELQADVLIEMDADFQHDPKDIKRLMLEIDKGADHVIGSRYIKGGGIPKEWPFYRKFLSFGGNVFAKLVLGIWIIDDFTSGFKATRVKGFMDQIDFSTLETKGFAYKMGILFRLHKLNAKFTQIPIKFLLREKGSSKMESNNMLDSMRVVLTLRARESKNFIKFCFVGAAGLIVDAGLFNILLHNHVAALYSALTSGFIAMLVTFSLNNYWSFKERSIKSSSDKILGFVIYIVSSSIPILVRSRIVLYAGLWFGHNFYIYNAAFFIGVIFGLIWNFLVYSRIIWKHR